MGNPTRLALIRPYFPNINLPIFPISPGQVGTPTRLALREYLSGQKAPHVDEPLLSTRRLAGWSDPREVRDTGDM